MIAINASAAVLLCGVAFSFNGTSEVSAQPDATTTSVTTTSVRFENAAGLASAEEKAVTGAVADFIRGMAEGDAETVWFYASEEEQAAFQTEQALYTAFAAAFPVLIETQSGAFQRVWREGETPFVALALRDRSGGAHQATFGLWLDDAGDWEIISADVKAATDQVALAH